MSPFADIAMACWTPLTLCLFALLPARRAVLASVIAGWMFLPVASYPVEGLPDFSKIPAIFLSLLLAILIFDSSRLFSFRLRRIDLPMLIWCAVPMASSLSNDLGLYDGFSSVLDRTIKWGLPYVIGRMYFNDLRGLRELAIGIVIGAIVYIPLCVWEMRMSPQLHYSFYGFYQHSFAQTRRFGGWRPMVFMDHGLMVGTWMASGSMIGLWLWASRSIKSIARVPMPWVMPVLLIATVLVKSTGAVILLASGLGALFTAKRFRTAAAAICLMLVPPAYIAARMADLWTGSDLVAAIGGMFDDERSQSLQTRLSNEDILKAQALRRPLLGWGGWGRNRVTDAEGRDVSITDGLWVIALGNNGLVGLVSLFAMLLLPAGLLLNQRTVRHWDSARFAPVFALAMVVLVYAIDCLHNAMVNPVYTLAMGGLAGFATAAATTTVRQAHAVRRAPAENPPATHELYRRYQSDDQ